MYKLEVNGLVCTRMLLALISWNASFGTGEERETGPELTIVKNVPLMKACNRFERILQDAFDLEKRQILLRKIQEVLVEKLEHKDSSRGDDVDR